MKLRELIEAVNNFTEIEVLERDEKSAKIYLNVPRNGKIHH
jgi:hypothetical protein